MTRLLVCLTMGVLASITGTGVADATAPGKQAPARKAVRIVTREQRTPVPRLGNRLPQQGSGGYWVDADSEIGRWMRAHPNHPLPYAELVARFGKKH